MAEARRWAFPFGTIEERSRVPSDSELSSGSTAFTQPLFALKIYRTTLFLTTITPTMSQSQSASVQQRGDQSLMTSPTGGNPSEPLSLSEQCALPLATVAAELAPIPYIGDVVKDLIGIFVIIGRARVNREQWRLLQGRCVMVARIAGSEVANGGGTHYPKLAEAAEHLKRTIANIGQRADQWNKMNVFVEFLQFKNISEEIKNHFAELDACMSYFSQSVSVSQEQWVPDFNVVQQRELAQLELFLNLLREQMHIEFEPVKKNLETIEKRTSEIYRLLEQVVQQKHNIFKDPENKTVAEYADAEEVLQVIRIVAGIQLPASLLVGRQCVLESPLPIRTGVTCDVYQARFLTERVAKKVFRIGTSDKDAKFVRDASLWATFKSEYTLPLYGIGMETAGVDKDAWQLYMVSPLMKNYDAVTYLKKYRNNPNMREGIMRIITDAAEGLKYLHNRNPPVVHSGMRGDNILITDSGGGILGGFGLTRVLATGDAPPTVMTGRTDSYRWMAPEMLSVDQPPLQTHCDIWGWAMAALELTSGIVPFHEIRQPWAIMSKITSNIRPIRRDYPDFERCALNPDRLWSLLERCWVTKPEDRPTIDEVVLELHRIQSPLEERLIVSQYSNTQVENLATKDTMEVDVDTEAELTKSEKWASKYPHVEFDLAEDSDEDVVPNSYIITLKINTDMANHIKWVKGLYDEDTDSEVLCAIEREYEIIKGYSAQLDEKSLCRLVESQHIESVTSNTLGQPAFRDDVPAGVNIRSNVPWGLQCISSRVAVNPASAAEGYIFRQNLADREPTPVDVYVMDSGVYVDHEEFGGRASLGKDFTGKPDDVTGHGTQVAGIIAGARIGVCADAYIHAVKVIGTGGAKVDDCIKAFEWVQDQANASQRASIINYSIVHRGVRVLDKVVRNVIAGQRTRGSEVERCGPVFVCAAAGNAKEGKQAENAVKYSPGRVPEVVTVAASDVNNRFCAFSHWGPAVTIVAPGENILSASIEGSLALAPCNGTSFAAPHVTGVAACILSFENLTPAELSQRLVTMATNGVLEGIPTQDTP